MRILDEQEKTAKKLQDEGFEVRQGVQGASGARYDLVAQRNGQSIVFEFKRPADLNGESAAISRLRQSARQDGYSDFRLVVVPEERTVAIEISGLNKALHSWLENHPEVTATTPLENADVVFQRVEQVQISSLLSQSGSSGTKVSGIAVVEFLVPSPQFGVDPDAIWDCPIYFDARLDAKWELESVQSLVLDISSIKEDLQEYLETPSAT